MHGLFHELAALESSHKLQKSTRRSRCALATRTYETFQFPGCERVPIRVQILLGSLRLQARQTGDLAQKQRLFGDLEHVDAVIVDAEKCLAAAVRGEQVWEDEVAVGFGDVSHAAVRGIETRGWVRKVETDAWGLVYLGRHA